MRLRVFLVILGFLMTGSGAATSVRAAEIDRIEPRQKTQVAGLPTRTDPQGTIGGGVGEFGGPPGPTTASDARTAKKRGSGTRQDKDAGQKGEGQRLGSCRP